MNAVPQHNLWSLLSEELAPRPGRVAAVIRIGVSCAIVVAIAMLYQIPLAGYMAYAVFLISRDDAASTLLTGLVAAVAFTIAIIISLIFYMLDASEPALRLPLMAVSVFVGIFLSRTIKLGPIAFLVGYLLVMSQTLIDKIPNLEALTRIVLWLWVVVMVPITITVLVNLIFGVNPARLVRSKVIQILSDVASSLRNKNIVLDHRHQAEALGLLELRHKAGILDRQLKNKLAIDTMLIETLVELLTLYQLLPKDTPDSVRIALAANCEQCIVALEPGRIFESTSNGLSDTDLRKLPADIRPVAIAMDNVLTRLSNGLSRRSVVSNVPQAPTVNSFFIPDAFTNPNHARFALKTTIAAITVYIIYNGIDWTGLSTAVTTCFFVALDSLGETMHKLSLRIAGALVGGLLGGVCIVYVLPELDDIGQLSLLIAVVSIICGWVATSSNRLSYFGMQMAFAFFLGVLQNFEPSTDLTVLRDRVVGILLGNIVMSVVFSVAWPTSAFDLSRKSISTALNSLGQILEGNAKPGGLTRMSAVKALCEARRFIAISIFELRMLQSHKQLQKDQVFSVDFIERLTAASLVTVNQNTTPNNPNFFKQQDANISTWFKTCADGVASRNLDEVIQPEFEDYTPRLEIMACMQPTAFLAGMEARLLLKAEIVNAQTNKH